MVGLLESLDQMQAYCSTFGSIFEAQWKRYI